MDLIKNEGIAALALYSNLFKVIPYPVEKGEVPTVVTVSGITNLS